MDSTESNPNAGGFIPPIDRDFVLCIPNFTEMILMAVEMSAAGAPPMVTAHIIATQIFDIVTSRIDRAVLQTIAIPSAFAQGGQN